jgi:hypothetical protein
VEAPVFLPAVPGSWWGRRSLRTSAPRPGLGALGLLSGTQLGLARRVESEFALEYSLAAQFSIRELCCLRCCSYMLYDMNWPARLNSLPCPPNYT